MELHILATKFNPNDGPVSVLLEHEVGGQFFVDHEQSAVQALAPAGRPWSDAEVLAATQAAINDPARFPKLAGKGYVVRYPAPPAPPVAAEGAVPAPVAGA